MTLTYVYCLVRSPRRPVMRGVPAAVTGGTPARLLDAGEGLWAVVSSVPAGDYDEAALARGLIDLDWVGQRALAHEAVVEHFLGSPAVLPMQLFTLFASDERAQQHVARDRRQLDRILLSIERQLEWGLRLSFDERAVIDGTPPRADVSGSAYLARKRDLRDAAKSGRTDAMRAAERLYTALAQEASASRRRTDAQHIAPGSRVLVDAAFLVPARRSAGFRAALRRHAKLLGTSGVVVSLTGPWPPYNFITPLPRASTRTRASGARASTAPARATAAARRKRAAR